MIYSILSKTTLTYTIFGKYKVWKTILFVSRNKIFFPYISNAIDKFLFPTASLTHLIKKRFVPPSLEIERIQFLFSFLAKKITNYTFMNS